MDLICRTTVSRFGNSRAVIIPKSVSDFPLKSKIDLFKTGEGILIKPVEEWSLEKQNKAISDLLLFAASPENDEEPIPDDFIERYCTDDNTEDLDFSGLEEN
ncbi:MAG: hypothetical protein LBI36_03915 [Oscillospiraceae bacterium]|jgi:antitoxin component of MazEF toxin-antitoxin module|nr:hypothetical protein [Oscillospiraceae bacterium]